MQSFSALSGGTTGERPDDEPSPGQTHRVTGGDGSQARVGEFVLVLILIVLNGVKQAAMLHRSWF